MLKAFTIGYGGRHPNELIRLLVQAGVRTVADVRLKPDRANMGAYTKAKSSDKGIEKLLRAEGINYVSFVELGNIFIEFDDWRDRYWSLLASSGDLLVHCLLDVTPTPFCLLCAEKNADECHRKQIADYLTHKGWQFQHL
jgi:uncharacterized protein (DUF488 family)